MNRPQTMELEPQWLQLLLDNLSGMAAVSFAQKAVQSGMLTEDEGRAVLAIVQLAAPGEAEPHSTITVTSKVVDILCDR